MPSLIPPSFCTTRKTTVHARSALVAVSAFLLAISAAMATAGVAVGQDDSATTTPDLTPLVESWKAGGTVTHDPWVWQPAIDPLTGDIWVAASYEDQYWITAPDGTFLEAWGTAGSEPGQFKLTDNRPSPSAVGSLAFAPDGSFYVADVGNYRIQHFDHDRNLLASWGSFGTDDGQFVMPLSIATDGTMVYVSDNARQDIQVFDVDGTYERSIAGIGPGVGGGWIALAPSGRLVVSDLSPVDSNPLATDQGGGISIVDPADGTTVSHFSIGPKGWPLGIAVDAAGDIYVNVSTPMIAPEGPVALVELDPQGNTIGAWSTAGETVAVTPDGSTLYLASGWPVLKAYALPDSRS